MRTFIFLLSIFSASFAFSADPEVKELRVLYDQSAKSKSSADQLLKILNEVKKESVPILIGYKGAAEMMQAKYVFSPISKLKRFNTGKQLIEEAVKKAPENLEIRFLRFTIQSNLPSFLGYNEQIDEDKSILLAGLDTLKDNELKQSMIKYLSSSKHCSEEERKGLKT